MSRTMKEILTDFKQTLAVTMQSTRNIVDVTQHYIDEMSDAESSGAGGIDYSKEEQDTGLKWIDGKKIYQKTFELTSTISLNNSSWTNVVSISGISTFINIECLYGGQCCDGRLRWKLTSNYIQGASSVEISMTTPTITIWYTKAS